MKTVYSVMRVRALIRPFLYRKSDDASLLYKVGQYEPRNKTVPIVPKAFNIDLEFSKDLLPSPADITVGHRVVYYYYFRMANVRVYGAAGIYSYGCRLRTFAKKTYDESRMSP